MAKSIVKYYSFTSNNRTVQQADEIYRARLQGARDVFEKFSDEFYRRECPFCGTERSVKHGLFDERYGIDRCQACSSLYVNPIPSERALAYYYNSCSCNGIVGALLRERFGKGHITISSRTSKLCDLISRYTHEQDKKQIAILEIGCNSGVLLSELRDALVQQVPDLAVDLVGIDVDRNAIERNVDERNRLLCSSAEDFVASSEQLFDFVIHFELIEHLPNPFIFNRKVNSLLVPGGINFFTTPNGDGFDNTAVGFNRKRPMAHAIYPPMHLNAFTLSNLPLFALRTSFDVISIETPGVFDVDITKLMREELDNNSLFAWIDIFDDEQLAVIQLWLQELRASSHMEVVLRKQMM